MGETQLAYDVVIVGASVAGNAAAMLLAQAGLRVALIERSKDVAAYKKACTHYIQPAAMPVLKQLGLHKAIEAAGGLANGAYTWTPWGWFGDGAGRGTHGYNVRREVLDPIMRRAAAATPGVDLYLGTVVGELVLENGRFTGIRAHGPERSQTLIRARLVVGADGRYSRTAQLASVQEQVYDNNRFIYFAYYQGLPLPAGQSTLVWQMGEDVAYAMPNDNGYTLLAVMLPKKKLDAFKQDVAGNFERVFQPLAAAPVLANGRRTSDFVGMLNMPLALRQAARPGLALVGDAALVTDPIWGNGITAALLSARWLAQEVTSALKTDRETAVDAALASYQLKHYRTFADRFAREVDFAQARPFNWLERLFYAAAVHDRHFWRFAGPHSGRLANRGRWPSAQDIGRALRVYATARQRQRGVRRDDPPPEPDWLGALAD